MKSQSSSRHIVGIVKGPGDSSSEYVFITADAQPVRIGEFVYYELSSPPSTPAGPVQQVLGRITGCRLIEHLPHRMFADHELNPGAVAALIGFTCEPAELYEMTVEVMGEFHEVFGFNNLRRLPLPGAKVYLAEDDLLQEVLNKKKPEERGAAHIGSLLLREEGAVPIALDVKELVSTHMAILAGTGSGKSYTAGVLVEELLSPKNRAAVLILDPHGEYHTLTQLRGHPAFKGEDGYQPEVKVIKPGEVKIRVSSLEFYDILTLLPPMSDRQQAILKRAYDEVRRLYPNGHWSTQDLITAVYAVDRVEDEEGNVKQGSSADALAWKLEKMQRSDYFHPYEHLPPHKLFTPGQLTILQMNEIPLEQQQVIATAILRQTNHARMNTQKDRVREGDEQYLPYPVFILIEEAHRFAPAHEPSQCKQVLRTILSEGRKFGLGVGLITQRPGKLDSDVLSQCMSQFILRIVNPVDQESLKHGVEAAGRELLKELPALSKGQVIIAGACVNTPVLCRVRQRLTTHGGETLDAPELWQEYFAQHKQLDRMVAMAGPAPRPQPRTIGRRSLE
ncbi:helicase HerA domain-containing protein [Thermosynechococcus sp.]|uniref:helicase HerA domain-containing protein n=1 Tax=Thermosynechococcus sp. TaxID=2814275 RepID=UPI00391AF5F2